MTQLDAEKLARWLRELDAGVSMILGSRRWRLGRRASNVVRRLMRKLAEPAVPPEMARIREEYGRWRARGTHREHPRQGAAAEASWGAALPGVRAAASAPSVSDVSSLRYGPAGHVLEALKRLPPVAVVVPIHNAYEDLERCLESLVRNTTVPAELLLVDDASTDPRVRGLLSRYAASGNARVLHNAENLGFSGAVNRGFSESAGDVVLLNSDAEVTPRWLENLALAAYRDPRTATVTAISDNAGAFSVPEIGKKNATPQGLTPDEVGRLVTQTSAQIGPHTPTANGFCMYVKRAALDEVGLFDAENFPRGYGEENDFCMRASRLGWNHVVDDATFVFHARSASFGEEKARISSTARATLDALHPDYALLARAFVTSQEMGAVGENVDGAFRHAHPGNVRPRLLFVVHQARGGTTFTNEDLMGALSDRYSPYLLVSNVSQLKLFRYEAGGLVPLEQWNLGGRIQITEFSRPDYRAVVFDLMTRYRFELVHVRHLIGHTFDLPEVVDHMGVPVVLSFHDFYFSCPTVHLIDDKGRHCGGVCTPGFGQCTLPTPRLRQLPVLKHAYLHTWREQVERMFGHVSAFVTTSRDARETYLRSLPFLRSRRFEIIEHGRDLRQARCATPPGDGPIKILLPGNVNPHKGANFAQALKRLDREGRLEFHLLGRVAPEFRDLGIDHGTYEREEFNQRVREVSPSFIGIFSVAPETYCHTLTEAWGAGIPVLATTVGALKERVEAHGGGWLLDLGDPEGSYRRILEISADHECYERGLVQADLHGIKSVKQMSDDYERLYESVLLAKRSFARPSSST